MSVKSKTSSNFQATTKKQEISDDELFKLKEQGMSYQDMAKYFANNGIKTSFSTISRRCQTIYAKKGVPVPKSSKRKRKNIEISDDELFKLKESGMSYQDIADYFANNGIKTSVPTIARRCNDIYTRKDLTMPRASIGRRKNIEISDDELFKLRESGMSYRDMAKYLADKGIKVSVPTIALRCQTIYAKKGVPVPKSSKRKRKNIEISDDELFKLRESGMSYRDMAKYLADKGIKTSFSTIERRCQTIYAKKRKPNTETALEHIPDESGETLSELDTQLNKKLAQKMAFEKFLDTLREIANKKSEGITK